jgi:alanine racemase
MKDAESPIQPVVTLQGQVVHVRTIGQSEYVGYGLSYKADAPLRTATVAVSYADGGMRLLSNRGSVLLHGQQAPIVGRVSMDTITIDVTGINAERAVNLGKTVDLISPLQSVDTVAKLADTIDYEILTSLGSRFHRTYTGEL